MGKGHPPGSPSQPGAGIGTIRTMQEHAAALVSTTDPISRGMVGVVLLSLFAVLAWDKAHRVLVALGAVALLWVITYLTPWHLISFEDAGRAVDLNVLFLLAGMMTVVGVLKTTGVFGWAVSGLLGRAGNRPVVVLGMVVWFTGVTSAFLDNVTTVIFMAPIAIGMARQMRIRPIGLLLPMVIASNLGGTATLIGDPPNIMIGSGAGLSFVDFLEDLTMPILIMLLLTEWFSRRWFAEDLTAGVADAGAGAAAVSQPLTDRALLRGMGIICTIVLAGFLTHGMTGMPAAVPAVVGAAAALILQDALFLRRLKSAPGDRVHGILQVLEHEIEWPTLAFFTFLFIVVGAAVQTGLISSIAESLGRWINASRDAFGLGTNGTLLLAAVIVLVVSGFLSALIDNIPYVAVTIPIIHGLTSELPGDASVLWWALSLGACLGGNGTPIGASANVTTLDIAARHGTSVSFATFTRYGATIVLMTLAVSAAWLYLRIQFGKQGSFLIAGAVFLALLTLRLMRRPR